MFVNERKEEKLSASDNKAKRIKFCFYFWKNEIRKALKVQQFEDYSNWTQKANAKKSANQV